MSTITSGRRSLITAFAVTGIVALTMTAAAITAAVVTAEPVGAHGPSANGCTGVPDTGPGFRFHSICDRHDRCYGTRPYGHGSAGRRTCDRVFRSEMLAYCSRHARLSPAGFACRSVARAYHLGVRALGAPFWSRHRPAPIA